MALFEQQEIYLALEKSIRDIISELRIRPSDGTILIYVPRDRISDQVKPGFTSERQLENLKRRLSEEYSKRFEYVLTASNKHRETEEAVFTLLNINFAGSIISFYMSFGEDNNVSAWIEVVDLTDRLKNAVLDKLASILSDIDLEIGSIDWLNSQCDLPSLPWILRQIKIHQPITLGMAVELCAELYPAINEKWVNSKLDQLRKKKLIIREKSGTYVLTVAGLSSVPSGLRSNSSDVYRALELGRKKWSN